MNDERLEQMLRSMAEERFLPSRRCVLRTKAAIRGRRLLRTALFLSLGTQVMLIGFILFLLTVPGAPVVARVCAAACLFTYAGAASVTVIAARGTCIKFFKKIERLAA